MFKIMMVVFVFFMLTFNANAQQICVDRDFAIKHLETKFSEYVIGRGIVNNGKAMLEVTVNQKTGAWSVIISEPNGMTCLYATGDDWQTIPVDNKIDSPS